MKKIKELFNRGLAILLDFTTGLGFYGIGLLAVAVGIYVMVSTSYVDGAFWVNIGSAFLGAFVFKNFKAIVDHVKSIKK